MKRRALITGIAGQDGSYLAELLVEKGYEVYGVVRKESLEDPLGRLWRLKNVYDRVTLLGGSVDSHVAIYKIVDDVRPAECYHLAAQSFISYDYDDDFSTMEVNVHSTHFVLSAIRQIVPECRVYFAGSSEMFGRAETSPQNEDTQFRPRSLYGISKVAASHLARGYRETYGLHASIGILYNHESPRRGTEFVSRKISSHVAKIDIGQADRVKLGNLDAVRDWGHARDYVRAMWLMLQQDRPDDYVVATGRTHTVRDLLATAFGRVGLEYKDYVEQDDALWRPVEKVPLVGDAAKARRVLGWEPTVSFEAMVEEMVDSDLALYGGAVATPSTGREREIGSRRLS
jgi:GDPmannose 4,6-dehydratase